MMDLFEQLKLANQPGVYLLVNEPEKLCYINYSNNISQSLVRQLSSNLLFPVYDFSILEIVTEPINLRPRCQYYKDQYSNKGYSLINPKRVSNWKLRIEPIHDFTRIKPDRFLFAVNLVSKGYHELTVGVFSTYPDVESFINKYYAGNLVTSIIYNNNDLTRKYLNDK